MPYCPLRGTIDHLVDVLKEHLSPIGQPPETATWMFEVPEPGADGHDFAKPEIGALIRENRDNSTQMAINNIAEIAEIADAFKEAWELAIQTNGADHVAKLLQKLANQTWYTDSVSSRCTDPVALNLVDGVLVARASSATTSPTHRIGYQASVIDRRLLEQLVKSASKIAGDAIAERDRSESLDQIPPYGWPRDLAEDAWIYQHIHNGSLSDLRVEHSMWCQSQEKNGGPYSRNTYKARVKRYSEYHHLPVRFFKKACNCPECQPVTDT